MTFGLRRVVGATLALGLATTALAQTCGLAAGQPRLTPPVSMQDLCSVGAPTLVTGTGPFSWGCISSPAIRSCSTRANCLDLDGNQKIETMRDGLLAVRMMLGLTGTAVTANAVAPGAPRDTHALIKSYIDTHCSDTRIVSSCVPNSEVAYFGTAASLTACVNKALPLEGSVCCAGTFSVIIYDSPVGSGSCSATCGPRIAGAGPETSTGSD